MFFRFVMVPLIGTLLLGTSSPSHAAEPPNVAAIVRHVDDLRLPNQSLTMQVTITPSRDGVAEEPSVYTLYSHRDGGKLLKGLNLDQRGQKFLTTENGMWFYAPRTHRAIRLTPLQTLRGQASVGDITQLHWSRDYDAALAQSRHEQTANGGRIWLVLTANNDLSTYATIRLAVSDSDWSPLEAKLFSASGRLLKTVEFAPPVNGRVTSARYIDGIDQHRETLVQVGTATPKELPIAMFNPRALEE